MDPRTPSLLFLALLLGGCVDLVSSSGEPTTDGEGVEAISRIHQGQVVYRTPLGFTPEMQRMSLGDPPSMCFLMPNGTTSFEAEFSWDVGVDMGIYLAEPESQFTTITEEGDTSPLRVTLTNPVPGEWFIYVGPGTAGGGYTFTLTLTFTTAAGTPIEETYVDEACW